MTVAYFNGELIPLHAMRACSLDRGFLRGDEVHVAIPGRAGCPSRRPVFDGTRVSTDARGNLWRRVD